MKMTEYAKMIAKIAEQHPNAEVIFSSDDEGNSFNKVCFAPSAGKLDHGMFGECADKDVNAVCIN